MNPYPTLSALLTSGDLWIDVDTYVGKAADGVEVTVGTVYNRAGVEAYLVEYPTPETW
jgi:hypothetical protein